MKLIAFALVAFSMLAQRSPEFGIRAKDASTTGVFYLEDLLGTGKINHRAPNSITSYTLTWPGSIAAGCLTANGSGVLTWQSCVSLPIDDSSTLIRGSADATKLFRFEVDGFTTATTRVATPPDTNFIMAGSNITQTWTANQLYTANLQFSGLRDIGEASAPVSNIYTNQIRIPAGPCFLAGMTIASSSGLVFSQNSSCNTVAEMDGSGLELLNSGSLRVSGTQVIDSSRRLLNISAVGSTLLPTASASFNLGGSGVTEEWFQLYVRQIPAVENINPKNSTSDIGYSGVGGSFRNGFFQNITVSGTCTGCTSIPDATQFTRGAVSTTTQSFAGNKTFFGSILPGNHLSHSLGNTNFRWLDLWAQTGNFSAVSSASGGFSSLSVTGILTIANVQGVFPGTGFIGTTSNRIGEGNFTSLSTSQFGSSTIHIGGGDFHNKSFFGSPSCAGRLDGWQGVDTLNFRIWVCVSGAARWVFLQP